MTLIPKVYSTNHQLFIDYLFIIAKGYLDALSPFETLFLGANFSPFNGQAFDTQTPPNTYSLIDYIPTSYPIVGSPMYYYSLEESELSPKVMRFHFLVNLDLSKDHCY